jgi:hypothetical protein
VLLRVRGQGRVAVYIQITHLGQKMVTRRDPEVTLFGSRKTLSGIEMDRGRRLRVSPGGRGVEFYSRLRRSDSEAPLRYAPELFEH